MIGDETFNIMLTNNVVSFEQLNPGVFWSVGREFKSLAAWYLKLFVPYRVRLALGISKSLVYLKL